MKFGCALQVAAAVAATAALSDTALADKFWVNSATTGNWSNPNNWSSTLGGPGGGGTPFFEPAWIRQSDAVNRNVTLDVSPNTINLRIGNSGGGTNTLTQSAAVNINASASIGMFGRGALIQSNG